MKLYDVFKSEGGWRVCMVTCYGGNPVIDGCPWYSRKCDATRRANKERKIAEATHSNRDF